MFRVDDNKVVEVGDRTKRTVVNLFKNLTHMPNIRAIKELNFVTLNIKNTYNYLRLAFIKVSIFGILI